MLFWSVLFSRQASTVCEWSMQFRCCCWQWGW